MLSRYWVPAGTSACAGVVPQLQLLGLGARTRAAPHAWGSILQLQLLARGSNPGGSARSGVEKIKCPTHPQRIPNKNSWSERRLSCYWVPAGTSACASGVLTLQLLGLGARTQAGGRLLSAWGARKIVPNTHPQ